MTDAAMHDFDHVRGLLSIKQFVHEYGIGRTRTFELLKSGRLKGVKNGARVLIPRAEAERFAASLPPARRIAS